MQEFLTEHARIEKASFHMPGHKGPALFRRLGYAGVSADHDITEIPGADDLRHPDGIIKIITDRYAALYGSRRAFISVNGSSAPIMAAVMTCVKPGHKLIAAADSHISVKNGAELAGAEVVYVQPEVLRPWDEESADGMSEAGDAGNELNDDQPSELLTAPGSLARHGDDPYQEEPQASETYQKGSREPGIIIAGSQAPEASLNYDDAGFPGGISAEKVGRALDAHPDADAVILPSPNYFGIVSDIRAIAEEVHMRGKVLIVDQAHGAHLKMFADAARAVDEDGAHLKMSADAARAVDLDKDRSAERASGMLPEPAEECGADIVIVSTHKTLASFTQTAVVNLFGDRVDPEEYERKLLMLESTSPSYILMESLAVNADIMERYGKELAASWRADLDFFYENVKTIPGIRVLTREMVRKAGCRCDFDDTKIVVDFSGLMLDGEEAEAILEEKGIYPEFHAGNTVMFLTGIGNVRQDYDLLLNALAEMV